MNPPTAAILGASQDRGKFGNKSVRAHLRAGYHVFPVNPQGGEIEGLTVHARLADVPLDTIDRVSLYLPPRVTLGVLDEIAAKQPKEVWFNPGTSNAEVIAKARGLGLNYVEGCSIVDLGMSPSQFAET
ncbi:MAG: CoA-binding protein [Planctomycetales bacterium]